MQSGLICAARCICDQQKIAAIHHFGRKNFKYEAEKNWQCEFTLMFLLISKTMAFVKKVEIQMKSSSPARTGSSALLELRLDLRVRIRRCRDRHDSPSWCEALTTRPSSESSQPRFIGCKYCVDNFRSKRPTKSTERVCSQSLKNCARNGSLLIYKCWESVTYEAR